MQTNTRSLNGLPKWAQDEIMRLRRENTELNNRLQEMASPREGAKVYCHLDFIRSLGFALPQHSTIDFKIGGASIQVSAREDNRLGDVLDIRSVSTGWLEVFPNAANSLYLKVK